jgi:rare lipoprotein A
MNLFLNFKVYVVALVGCALLSGCTEIMVGSHLLKKAGETRGCSTVGAKKIGNPYLIDGQRYTPQNSSKGHVEEGIASWYGDDFHGKATANGECYNMYAFTAAHRTLPLPTVVRVTNMENNKSVVVKVNDRGPFARGRIIDLSYAAAQSIGMVGKGTAPVRIEAIGGAFHEDGRSGWLSTAEREDRVTPMGRNDMVAETLPTVVPMTAEEEELAPLTQAARKEARDLGVPDPDPAIGVPPKFEKRVYSDETPLTNTLIFVQVGAFGDAGRAATEQLKLKENYPTAHLSVIPSNGTQLSRVRAGPFRSVADAEEALRKLAPTWPSAQIKVERR